MKSNYEKDCLTMVDEEKYDLLACVTSCDVYVSFVDKLNDKIIMLDVINPETFLQVGNNSFLTTFSNEEGKVTFQHLIYDNKNGNFKLKYEKTFDRSNYLNNYLLNNNCVVIREVNKTSIYNYKNGKTLNINDLIIKGTNVVGDNIYFVGEIKVNNLESLIVCIDSETLMFSEFYSVLQDRYISLVDSNDNIEECFADTLEKEVYKYALYIEELEESYCQNKVNSSYKKLMKKNNRG